MAKSKFDEKGITIDIKFDGGLNYAQTAWNMQENELTRLINFIFNTQSYVPEVRPGTDCITASALANDILKLYYYEKNTTTRYLVCASGGKLYYLNSTAWVEIGSLTDSTTTPSMVTFNAKLLIADGGSDIRTWDGTTYTTISGSPAANALYVIKNRVVANTSAELDSVYFSAPNDAESADAWDTTKNAVGIRCGYGDNQVVNAFSHFGDDLIISKKGDGTKSIYRINVSNATTTNWYSSKLSGFNCATNAHCMVKAFNNIFFLDTTGFKSLKGVTEYGDLQEDYLGNKINPIFTSSSTSSELSYIPLYAGVWFNVGDRTFTLTQLLKQTGDINYAFTELEFEFGKVISVCQGGSTVYLGAENGYLYKLDDTLDTDETAPSTTANYTATVRTKKFSAGGNDILLKSTGLRIVPITSGTVSLRAVKDDGTLVTLKTITTDDEGEYLYDATGELYTADGADDYLYDAGAEPVTSVSHNRVRSASIQFQIQMSGARCGIDGLWATLTPLRSSK